MTSCRGNMRPLNGGGGDCGDGLGGWRAAVQERFGVGDLLWDGVKDLGVGRALGGVAGRSLCFAVRGGRTGRDGEPKWWWWTKTGFLVVRTRG